MSRAIATTASESATAGVGNTPRGIGRALRVLAWLSFIAETVFSHESKLELIHTAHAHGYTVVLHAVLIPEELAVHRVRYRVAAGGHEVPEDKIRARYDRLWELVVAARAAADRASFYDNELARTPYRLVASYERGRLIGAAAWPTWTPAVLRD